MELRTLTAVALGAALGGVARYLVGTAFVQRFGPGFPWGTLFINVTGSFLIAIVAELALTRTFSAQPLFRIFAATGFLGGYTTFSTFSLDALTLAADGAGLLSALYGLASLALGVGAAYTGQLLIRAIAR